MQLIKIVLCMVSISVFNFFGAEYQKLHDQFYTKHIDAHKDVIRKDGSLFDMYIRRIHFLHTLTYIDENTQNQINAVTADYASLNNILAEHLAHVGTYKSDISFDHNQHLIAALQKQARLLKNGLQNQHLKFYFKIAADCLSRIVERHLPSQKIDWTQQMPMKAKTQEEKEQCDRLIASCKSKMVLERNQTKAFHCWLTFSISSLAVFKAYAAWQNPTIVTGGLAAALTAWAGYHGYTYNKLRKLPTPSDNDIYKSAAINLNPQFK